MVLAMINTEIITSKIKITPVIILIPLANLIKVVTVSSLLVIFFILSNVNI